jgi:hypothetical protein
MRHCAIALSGAQTNSWIVQGELCSPKVALEHCTDRRNLRSRQSLELVPTEVNVRAGVSL